MINVVSVCSHSFELNYQWSLIILDSVVVNIAQCLAQCCKYFMTRAKVGFMNQAIGFRFIKPNWVVPLHNINCASKTHVEKVLLFASLTWRPVALAAALNKFPVSCLKIHTFLSILPSKNGAIRYSVLIWLLLPEGTNCHDLKKNWLIPPCPFHFTTSPDWGISFQWVQGLCLEKRKQQLLLSQDFLTRGLRKEKNSLFSPLKQKRKVLMPRKRLQIHTSSGPFSQFLTPTHFLFFALFFVFLSHTQTQSLFCVSVQERGWEKGGKARENHRFLHLSHY